MNLRFYSEKLNSSEIFKKFKKENPKAYLCSGFFTIDKEGKDNQKHLDFYVPSTKKMFSFRIDDCIEKIPVERISKKIPEKINDGIDFNFEEIEQKISAEMENQKIKNKLQKIIISLQALKGKSFLVCTVFVSMLGLLKIHIDLEQNKIILFEKKSIFDMMKRVK